MSQNAPDKSAAWGRGVDPGGDSPTLEDHIGKRSVLSEATDDSLMLEG
jgi:hypothetical protein